MKTIGKILLGIIALIAIAISAIFFFTSDMVTTADDFFRAVKNKDIQAASAHLSEDFKASTPTNELEQYLKNNSLDKFNEADWGSRSISGGRGSLSGSVTTDAGGVIPITLNFVKGESGWKIYSIEKPASGLKEETSARQVPTEQEQVRLVAQSVSVFADAVSDKSMAKLHSHISNLWRQQVSIEELDEIFGGFYDFNADLRILNNYSPSFNAQPSVDENGVLEISGYYPTKPDQFKFEHSYIYEGLSWKLIGFSAYIE